MLAQSVASETGLQGAAWALVVAVVGLILREAWGVWRARQDQRERDRLVLSALLREISAIEGLANSIIRDIAREQSLLEAQQRWRLNPLITLPTGTYDLVKDRPPTTLLAQTGALRDLMRLQTQCAFTNALAQQQQQWKTPAADHRGDQAEVIGSLHRPILESVEVVVERCGRLAPALRAAGAGVGGLNLEGPTNPQRHPRR